MKRVAEVIINLPAKTLNKSFTYLIPDNLQFLTAGWRVLIPFGPRKAEGFIVSVDDGNDENLKAIIDSIDDEPWFSQHMLAVAQWISNYYLCTLAEAMRLFIPGKAGIKIATVYHATAKDEDALAILAAQPTIHREVCSYLRENGPQTAERLKKQFGSRIKPILRELTNLGVVESDSRTRKTAQAQYDSFWQLAVSRETAATLQQGMRRKPAQARVLTALLAKTIIRQNELKSLKISSATIKSMLEAGLLTAGQTQRLRDSYAAVGGTAKTVNLTDEQMRALEQIAPAISSRTHTSFLLHGITGSGKTQVYIEAVAKARQLGRQAIVLVPEIALTSQIVFRFKEHFGDEVVVAHSKLSVGERYDVWQRLRSGKAGIVVGARSAVFAPVADPGVIIIDEEHEFTYKQEEAPHYHTRAVALTRAKLAGGTVLMGSATPAVETYQAALEGKHKLLSMVSRVDGSVLPQVTVVDMREEIKEGRRSVISEPLRNLLQETIDNGEQAIILLNRRGYATFVLCRECGYVMRCEHCATSLVYHTQSKSLRCHYCEATHRVPDVCPACASRYIRYFGTGTQKVEEELAALVPEARIVRMDQDTTGAKMAHDRILSDFAAGKYDILLGTQMVAKGHDIKNVTAVGIISADTALNLPDFRAAERTFALLTQAAGRAGRGNRPGKVVVQTYNAEHYAIMAGAKHDYLGFFQQEIELRRELSYPPFSQLIKITVQDADEVKARRQAEEFTCALKQKLAGDAGEILGPFPAPVAKINDIYRMHILIKTDEIDTARAGIRDLGLISRGVSIDVDPLSVL